ncbi:MAG: ZIP family metal transporter [Halobacteriaceae archaeon]
MQLTGSRSGIRAETAFAAVSVLAFVGLSSYVALVAPTPKLLGVSWVAFAAMAAGALLGSRTLSEHPRGLVWGYGLAAGAMVTSAAVFLVPQAIGASPRYGGFGIAAGLLVGFAGHTVGHRLTHLELPMDRTVAELSAHAVSAGLIIGVVYTAMPDLGPLLGVAIVSHKGPAGYAAARRLVRNGRPVAPILLPASGVGVAALTVSLLSVPSSATAQGVVFGFAAGIFLHVAMDFLPRCETGSEVHTHWEESGHAHEMLDRLRIHAVVSTALGALAVYVAWVVV